MRYKLRARFALSGTGFQIENELGEPVGSLTDPTGGYAPIIVFTDVRGQELAQIMEVRRGLVEPVWEIQRGGRLAAVVHRESLLTVTRWKVDLPGVHDYQIEGDLLGHEFFFVHDGETVAEVSRSWFDYPETYGVQMLDREDVVLILAATTALDLAMHAHPDHHQRHGHGSIY